MPTYSNRLPVEIVDVIFKIAGALTRFRDGRLGPADKLTDEAKRSIWLDAFRISWDGDLTLLPAPPTRGKHVITNADLALVTNRDLYKRLCKYFPEATESKSFFLLYEERDHYIKYSEYQDMDSSYTRVFLDHLRLSHIPMRHMWLDVLQDWIDKYPHAVASACMIQGHFDLLKHLINNQLVDASSIMLIINNDEYYRAMSKDDVDPAVASNYIDMFKYLQELCGNRGSYIGYEVAALTGYLDVMVWLDSIDPLRDTQMLVNLATQSGHLDILKWIYDKNTDGFDSVRCSDAAKNGHLHVLQWFHEKNLGDQPRALVSAVFGGHLDVCKWIYSLSSDHDVMDEWTMECVARNGCLDVIKWLHEHNLAKFSDRVMDRAAANGHLDTVVWLHESRTEGCTTSAMDEAAMRGHLQVFKYLYEITPRKFTSKFIDKVASKGHLNIIQFFHEHQPKLFTKNTMDAAAKNGNIDLVKWLHENRTEGCGVNAINYAAESGHFEVVKFLVENRTEGFTASALRYCMVPEIVDLLIGTLSNERHAEMLELAKNKNWDVKKIEMLEHSLSD